MFIYDEIYNMIKDTIINVKIHMINQETIFETHTKE